MALTTVAEREVATERGDGVTVVTLDRPSQRNALTWQIWEELEQTLAAIREDPETRVVVLTGAGACFSAGGDVKSSPARGRGLGAPAARLALAHRVITELHRLPQVTIAAVEGFAVGAGWSLALACDLLVAADDAFFAAPFLDRGLVPDGGIAWFLTRTIGARRAADLFFTGRRISAADAHRDGLISRIATAGTTLDSARDLAQQVAAGPPDAQALTKRLLRFAGEVPFERFLEMEWTTAALDLHGDEVAEGRRSFLENRPPDFTTVRR